MIPRHALRKVQDALSRQPAVALLGPRQIGKTTLARQIAEGTPSIYLDLESKNDQKKLTDPALFLKQYEDQLVILDEIHRAPEIFLTLRGLIDEGRRKGKKTNRFLILGSASLELLQQAGESLAGRTAYIELKPLSVLETKEQTPKSDITDLWIRGGFPESYLATTDSNSNAWRKDFIRSYLERDIPDLGPRIPATTLERLCTMIAHYQGGLLNSSKIAASLEISAQTVSRYIDLLSDLLLLRRLPPFHKNIKKRLVKSPKIYIRDSGILHALLEIPDHNKLMGHQVAGFSWEGFVIENILNDLPFMTLPSFYRTATGDEIDLVLEIPNHGTWAIEIKHSLAPKLEKSFLRSCNDIKPDKRFIVYAGELRYPLTEETEAISVRDMMAMLKTLNQP